MPDYLSALCLRAFVVDAFSLVFSASSPSSRMKSIVGFTHVQIGNVRINLGRRDVCMPEQRLHRSRVSAMLHQVRGKAVTERVWRDSRNPGALSMSFHDGPCRLSRQSSSAMQKQLRLYFAAESLAHAEIFLQPVDRAFANRHAPLLASLPETGNQSSVNIDVNSL